MRKFISLDILHQTLKNSFPAGQKIMQKSLTGKLTLFMMRSKGFYDISMTVIVIKDFNCTILSCRFANTVTGQFYGHTHNDEFLTFYDVESNQVPVNVAFVTPSVTTYTGLNPSFRFYTLDGPYEGASMVSQVIHSATSK